MLYTIDISEKLLKEKTKEDPERNSNDVLADLIIKRILQKIILRSLFIMNIRKGTEKDIPQALHLVKELAVLKKRQTRWKLQLQKCKTGGFGKDKIFDFFVAEKESVIVGMALYYYKYSTWKGKCLFLEDIIVTEKERKNGYGKLLFNEVVKVAKQQKVRRMEWQVLDWNTPAIEFYKKYNSNLDPEWVNCKFTFDQLQSM